MDLPQENAGKDSPTYTMGSVTPAKRLSFLQDWTGRNENNDTSLDGIVSNTTIREPDQHDLDMDEMDKQRDAYNSDVLIGTLSEEPLIEGSVTSITDCLYSLGYGKSWYSNPRLYYIMHKMGRTDLLPKILDAEITDLWLPLHKRLVRKWMNDTDTRTFIKYQEFILDENIPVSLQGRHFTLDNMDQLDLRRIMFLGAGGFGEVHSVQNRGNGQVYACKTMSRPVRFDAHAEMMRNFKREIMGMRRVHHRHCVDLIASCTDTDSVTILSYPVADSGDLSIFLNANLNLDQLKILRHSVGCITSALAYLHSLNIR